MRNVLAGKHGVACWLALEKREKREERKKGEREPKFAPLSEKLLKPASFAKKVNDTFTWKSED